VALITATSLINHTADDLFDWASGCRDVVVLGATTPLRPDVFQGTPVTVLSGVVVRSPDDVLNVVSDGGGTKRFKGLTDKVNIAINSEGV
jgi:uncharacterized protein (DUF4213/DUF364 family)